MLVSKSKYKVGDVVSLRLITGEELVGKLTEETDTEYFLDRPLSLGQGPQGLGFTSCMITSASKADFSVQKAHVLLHTLTREEFADVYVESVSTIQIAR